ncbi:serine hydrolase [Sphingomonas sp.]|uniref:serine hydrolase n=1 Tax=Sphingomonas sp. TaxID=28214 RepID=UPI003B3AE590
MSTGPSTSRSSSNTPAPASLHEITTVDRPVPKPAPRDLPPPDLARAVLALGAGFQGEVGIAIRDVAKGWTVGYKADEPYPQQSVSKLWVAIALMDAVDRGRMSLSDPVIVRRSDLTLFHQPIRALVGKDGYHTTIGALLRDALTRSDNTCNDILLWKIGGPSAVRSVLAQRGIFGVGFGPGERILQATTAGLSWQPQWAGGWGFLQARAKMSFAARNRALRQYLAAPPDGASPAGITSGLALLQSGSLLSNNSTVHLLTLMRASKTGPLRLKSGLQPGWTFAHKTGTGQDLGTLSTGYNDVGLLRSPEGRSYAIAVMIRSTQVPIPTRMRLMGDVTRAVIRASQQSG